MLPGGVSKTIENEAKEQRGGFLSILLGTLGVSLLGSSLVGKGINRVGEGIVMAGYGEKGRKKKKKKARKIRQNYEKIKWIFNAASSFN